MKNETGYGRSLLRYIHLDGIVSLLSFDEQLLRIPLCRHGHAALTGAFHGYRNMMTFIWRYCYHFRVLRYPFWADCRSYSPGIKAVSFGFYGARFALLDSSVECGGRDPAISHIDGAGKPWIQFKFNPNVCWSSDKGRAIN